MLSQNIFKDLNENDIDFLEFIPSTQNFSQILPPISIIQHDLKQKDIDLIENDYSDSSCRLSDISFNKYILMKKGLLTQSEYEVSSHSEKEFLKEPAWIPLKKNPNFEILDLKQSKSAHTMQSPEQKIHVKGKDKKNDLKINQSVCLTSSVPVSKIQHYSLVTKKDLQVNELQKNLVRENCVLIEKIRNLQYQIRKSKNAVSVTRSMLNISQYSRASRSFDTSLSSFPVQNITKRLKLLKTEYKSLKTRLNQVNESGYLIKLIKDIKGKEKFLLDFEKTIKDLTRHQNSKIKMISHYNSEWIPNTKQSFENLVDELFIARQQISSLQDSIAKENELFELNKKKEEQLLSKISEWKSENSELSPTPLSSASSNKQNSPSDSLQDKFQSLSDTLQCTEKSRTSFITQLKNQEYFARASAKQAFSDLKAEEQKLQKKKEVLKNLRTELEELQKSSQNITQNKRSLSDQHLKKSYKIDLLSIDKLKKDIFEGVNSKKEVNSKFKGQILAEKFMLNLKGKIIPQEYEKKIVTKKKIIRNETISEINESEDFEVVESSNLEPTEKTEELKSSTADRLINKSSDSKRKNRLDGNENRTNLERVNSSNEGDLFKLSSSSDMKKVDFSDSVDFGLIEDSKEDRQESDFIISKESDMLEQAIDLSTMMDVYNKIDNED